MSDPTCREVARGRITAVAVNGAVLATMDTATARDLAEAFSTTYARCDELEQVRPWWLDDVVALVTAAARADVHSGNIPAPVMVPLLSSTAPSLRLVVGGEPA